MLAQKDDVNFNMLGYKFTQTVVVATPDMTLDHVLFSAEVPPDFAKQLLAYSCANAAAKQTHHAVAASPVTINESPSEQTTVESTHVNTVTRAQKAI